MLSGETEDTTWDDKEWVRRIQSGDDRAFARFYDAHAPALYRRLSRMLGNPEQAEDCLQQVFTEALRSIDQFKGEGKLVAWLERIATHVVMDQYRRKYRWRSFLERWSTRSEVDETSQEGLPEAAFFDQERKEIIWSLLDKMEPRKRIAVILCDLEGKTIEQAADELDVATGTAASRLRNGRIELRQKVEAAFRKQGISITDWTAS